MLLLRSSLGPEQNSCALLLNSARLLGSTSQSDLLPDLSIRILCTALHRLATSTWTCKLSEFLPCRVPLPPIL